MWKKRVKCELAEHEDEMGCCMHVVMDDKEEEEESSRVWILLPCSCCNVTVQARPTRTGSHAIMHRAMCAMPSRQYVHTYTYRA